MLVASISSNYQNLFRNFLSKRQTKNLCLSIIKIFYWTQTLISLKIIRQILTNDPPKSIISKSPLRNHIFRQFSRDFTYRCGRKKIKTKKWNLLKQNLLDDLKWPSLHRPKLLLGVFVWSHKDRLFFSAEDSQLSPKKKLLVVRH